MAIGAAVPDPLPEWDHRAGVNDREYDEQIALCAHAVDKAVETAH